MTSGPRRVAIVQARMTSTRLPGKVLADVVGRPMLARQLHRMRQARLLDDIVIATTTLPADDPVVALAEAEGARWFRGDEQDVLGRYLGAAREADAAVIVRLTADCPLLDPEVMDRVVGALDPGTDYASNTLQRTYPRGLDIEVLHRDVLERLERAATSRPAREHVTWFLHRERPELFVLRSVTAEVDDSDLRWTVDTEADLELVRALYRAADVQDGRVGYRALVERVRRDPGLRAINAGIEQKTP
jgi:spore coat polysaccharide biosynthesis protein SpsF